MKGWIATKPEQNGTNWGRAILKIALLSFETLLVESLHQVLLMVLFHCFIKLFYSEYIMQCQSTQATLY